jgi:hypothetical protein
MLLGINGTGAAWQSYGPEPPVPVTPPSPGPGLPLGPSPGMPARLYRSSAWRQALCPVGTSTPVVLRSTTAFALAHQIATGQEAAAVEFLDWCVAHQLTCVRVLVMCKNMFALAPDAGRAALPRVLQLAGARGLYVEAVALADVYDASGNPNFPGTDWAAHVRAVGEICLNYPNSLEELANEPMQRWQKFSPEQLVQFAAGIPSGVPYTLGAADGPADESTAYCNPGSSYQTVHADRTRAPWGNVRHIREQQVLSEKIDQYVWDDEPPKAFTLAQQFAVGGLCRVCMIADTWHSDTVRFSQIPTGEELNGFLARRAGWAFVPDSAWGTFANFGWTAPNPEPPIAKFHPFDADARAYSLLVGSNEAYTVLLNANSPEWKAGWTIVRHDERTSRADGQVETGLYHLRR